VSVYRLEPLNLNNPQWRLASYLKVVWVSADTSGDARSIAAAKTMVSREGVSFAPKLASPWLEETLSTCVLDTAKGDLPKGAAVTEDGAFF
jgi:hypothetical protein